MTDKTRHLKLHLEEKTSTGGRGGVGGHSLPFPLSARFVIAKELKLELDLSIVSQCLQKKMIFVYSE